MKRGIKMKISKELYMRISELTGVDYEGVVLNENEFYIEEETIIEMFKDLIWERDKTEERLEEQLEHEIQNRRDNYKPISPYEMYGVSERDFH